MVERRPIGRREFFKTSLVKREESKPSPEETTGSDPKRVTFPKFFFWGAATAAYSIEGAWREGGKGESIWDRFAHTPGKIDSGETGDVACDHYHRYREDIALMRDLHLTSYRFSLAWPRLQPSGKGKLNSEGLDFYSRLIDRLLEAGIRPFPTLYHWDLPQALEDAGGWPNRDTASRFADYAELAAQSFGDRVSYWSLLDEARVFVEHGYLKGDFAPGRKDLTAFLQAIHTTNLAQAKAFRAMKTLRPLFKVGSLFEMAAFEPATSSEGDQQAAERAHRFYIGWFLEPALRGIYPEAFPGEAPLARMGVRAGDLDETRANLDFIGVNHYCRRICRAVPPEESPFGLGVEAKWGGDEGPKTDLGWEIWPEALYKVLVRITRDYHRPFIEITGVGGAYADRPDERGVVEDARRIELHREYLSAVARAIEEGVKVRSYHAWMFLDGFGFAAGYEPRFGLIHVDFASLKRTLKESARWYARVARANSLMVKREKSDPSA